MGAEAHAFLLRVTKNSLDFGVRVVRLPLDFVSQPFPAPSYKATGSYVRC